MYINIFRSPFNDAHETVEVRDNVPIKEALPEPDYENSIIYVNGLEVDENYILKENDVCAIREFPAGKPGSSKGEILLGILTLGTYTLLDAIVSGVTGKTIMQNLTGAIESWIKPDTGATVNNTIEDPNSAPQLYGAKNQSNKGKPIPVVLGKHLYTPMYIGAPYTEIGGKDGEDQYYNVLFLLGWGELDVRDIKLGPISGLAKNAAGKTNGTLDYIKGDGFCDPSFEPNEPKLELQQGPNEVGLYPQKVVEERLNIELLNADGKQFEVIRFSAKNPQKVQIEFILNNGLISYDDQGNKKDASVEITVEWRGSSSEGWKEFGRVGTDGGLSPTQYNQAAHKTTITRQETKVMRFVAQKSFSFAEANAAVNRTVELRIVRANAEATDNRTADKIFLSNIRTWCFDNDTAVQTSGQYAGQKLPQAPMVQKYRDKTARLGFRVKAKDNLQGTIDALNCIVQSKARTWNGSAWSTTETPTNNPASVALKILQSPALGNNAYTGDSEEMLDLDSFGAFYKWCNDREYTCNGVLTNEKKVDDVLNTVLATGRGMRVLNGGKYAVLIDEQRDNPVMILNNQNVLEARNQKNFEDLPDGFSVKFIHESDGYQETEVYVMADGSAKPQPESRIEAIEMPFVTDHEQITKNGRYMLACRRLRPELWMRKVSAVGYLIGIGDRVEVQDDTIVVGIGEGGRITKIIGNQTNENYLISEIQTDGVFDIADITNKQFGVKIIQFDGAHDGTIRTISVPIPAPGTYSNFTFNPPISLPYNLQTGDVFAFGEYGKITTPAICFGKKSNGDGTFELTLIPYQEGIYTTDSGKIPDYIANITPPQKVLPAQTIPPDSATKIDVVETVNERIMNMDVNRNLYQLILSIQSRILDCDHGGNILEGLLPFTSRATLYRGVDIVDNSGIIYYPGTGGNIFDPMLGSFTPITNDIKFSLRNAPEGVTITEKGSIIVSKNAKLSAENYITVVAEYLGQIFTTTFYIKRGIYTPRYLGACYEQPIGTNTVKVKKGVDMVPVVAWQGDWVSYLGENSDGSIWKKGSCMRWNGTQWEEVPMKADGNFESNPYMVAAMDFLEGAPSATFLTLLVGDLIAKTAMIEKIFSKVISLGFVSNTDRGILLDGEAGEIRSYNYQPDTGGFLMKRNKTDGIQAEFTDIRTRNLEITGELRALLAHNGGSGNLPLTTTGGFLIGVLHLEYDGFYDYIVKRSSGEIRYGWIEGVGDFFVKMNTLEIAQKCIVFGFNSDNGKVQRVAVNNLGQIKIRNFDANNNLKNSNTISILIV